jgi:glycosyltransferase involved in cell wall biosynthesis
VTQFVANSTFVRERIARHYGRDAVVIHPYVDAQFLEAPMQRDREDYHVVVSALVPYKRVDLAIRAVLASGRKLVVIGGGPLLEEMRAHSGPNVEIAGSVSRSRIVEALARARSLILPGVEDFGITPLEAMGAGTPVVAFREGGVLDSVVEGETGIFFDEPTVESLRAALDRVEGRTWDRASLRARAAEFSRERFDRELRTVLNSLNAECRSEN